MNISRNSEEYERPLLEWWSIEVEQGFAGSETYADEIDEVYGDWFGEF